jgi:hypothetical protein
MFGTLNDYPVTDVSDTDEVEDLCPVVSFGATEIFTGFSSNSQELDSETSEVDDDEDDLCRYGTSNLNKYKEEDDDFYKDADEVEEEEGVQCLGPEGEATIKDFMTKYFMRSGKIMTSQDDLCEYGTRQIFECSQVLSEVTTGEFRDVVDDLCEYAADFDDDDFLPKEEESDADRLHRELSVISSSSSPRTSHDYSSALFAIDKRKRTQVNDAFYGNGKFEFIRSERDRCMYQLMHKAIGMANLWDFMHVTELGGNKSFMFSNRKTTTSSAPSASASASLKGSKKSIMTSTSTTTSKTCTNTTTTTFNENSGEEESLFSFASMMRDMEFISKHGYAEFERDMRNYYKRMNISKKK